MPKLRNRTITWYKKHCDDLFSRLIREKGYCEWCGARNRKVDCSHVVPRGNQTLRYNPINAIALCHVCHRFRWHADPLGSLEWFNSKYPHRAVYLQETRKRLTKRTLKDWEELYKRLKERDIKWLVKLPLDNILSGV